LITCSSANTHNNNYAIQKTKNNGNSIISNSVNSVNSVNASNSSSINSSLFSKFNNSNISNNSNNGINSRNHISICNKITIDVAVLCQEYTTIEKMCHDHIIN
jgi:hypothetical protein